MQHAAWPEFAVTLATSCHKNVKPFLGFIQLLLIIKISFLISSREEILLLRKSHDFIVLRIMIGTGTEDSTWHLSRDGFMSVSPRPTSDFDVGFTVVWQLLNLFCLTAFCANYLSDCHSMRDRLGPQIQVLISERVLYNRSLYIAVTAPGVAEMLSSAQFSIVQNFWGGSFLPQERGVYIISEYSKWLWNGWKTDAYLCPSLVQIIFWH